MFLITGGGLWGWWIIECFLTPKRVREYNGDAATKILMEMKMMKYRADRSTEDKNDLFEVKINVASGDSYNTYDTSNSIFDQPFRESQIEEYRKHDIPPKKRKNYSKKESDKCWLPKGKSVSVSGITINNGLIYFGQSLVAQKGYHENDNCLINPILKVAKNSFGIDNEHMPYWPAYEEISAKHRRAYLEWLANGAEVPNVNIGYVFLYFYGLERRLFLDQSMKDAPDIVREIKRLLNLYSDNHSIKSYLSESLSVLKILLTDKPILQIPENHWKIPVHICVYIGEKLKEHNSISSEDLLTWYLHHPEKRLRTPAMRLENEFLALMLQKMKKAFPSGHLIRVPKRKLSLSPYIASSGTFTADLSNLIGDIPDISSLKSPITKVQKIADEVMYELDKLSRYLGRNPDNKGSFKAAALLPADLVADFGGKAVQELNAWVSEKHEEAQGVISMWELTEMITPINSKSSTKTAHKEAFSMLASMGWALFPSPYELIGTIKEDFKGKVIPLNASFIEYDEPSPSYLLAVLELTIGSYIAHADNTFSSVEMLHLMKRAENAKHVSKQEHERLIHFISWLAVQKPDFSAIKRKLKSVPIEDQCTLVNIAISVAASDGHIGPEEVHILEVMCETFGLDKQELYSGLHSMSTAGSQKAFRQKSEKAAPVEGISNQEEPRDIAKAFNLSHDQPFRESQIPEYERYVKQKSNELKRTGVSLDMTKISATLQDTAKASSLLESIFQEPDAEEVTEPCDAEPETNNVFIGLDGQHAQLLMELTEKLEWPRVEYEQLTSSLSLMPDGAMETINEWSFEKFDDVIIENSDPITIYKNLLDEGSKHE